MGVWDGVGVLEVRVAVVMSVWGGLGVEVCSRTLPSDRARFLREKKRE